MARESLVDRMRRSPNGWKLAQVRRVLVSAGFERSSTPGDHDVYRHRRSRDAFVVVPRHRVVKPYLVRLLLAAIDSVSQGEDGQDGPNA